MRLRILAFWDNLRSSYWFLPTLMAFAATVLAYSLIAVNDYLPETAGGKLKWLYGGGPEGARSVLSTIAGSVITVAGTTFSITIAALTLASSQFGPRLLRTFRRDTGNQVVLGTFISTFLYCLLVLRTVLGTDKRQYVPDLAVTVGVLLAIFSLAVLIYFIHHTAASIQVSSLLNSVEHELNCTIEDTFPEDYDAAPQHHRTPLPTQNVCEIQTGQGGYLLRIDYHALISFATTQDCCVFLHLKAGDFCLSDFTLATITPGAACQPESRALRHAFYFGEERSPHQDPEHALLQVAEIAVRALSPGINDPFTAIAGLDKLTASMSLLAGRRRAPTHHYDDGGKLRVVAAPLPYNDLVVAAFQFIRRAASDNREVLLHLSSRLTLLLERTTDASLQDALAQQLKLTEQDLQASAQ